MPPDPRDAEFIERITAAVIGLIRACDRDNPAAATAEMGALLTAIMEHRKTMAERPGDAALRRALARL